MMAESITFDVTASSPASLSDTREIISEQYRNENGARGKLIKMAKMTNCRAPPGELSMSSGATREQVGKKLESEGRVRSSNDKASSVKRAWETNLPKYNFWGEYFVK